MHIRYLARPSPHLIIDDFLNQDTLEEALQATKTLYFSRRESDVFSFEESPDLTRSNHPGIEGAQRAIKKMLPMVRKRFTGRFRRLDMSGKRYRETDYILCHDHPLEHHKVAYILYLSNVSPKDGAALLLRSSKKPYHVLARITPKKNRLVLFQISPRSWHEVEEVRGPGATLFSLEGWLHA